jgi:hypothetical protein
MNNAQVLNQNYDFYLRSGEQSSLFKAAQGTYDTYIMLSTSKKTKVIYFDTYGRPVKVINWELHQTPPSEISRLPFCFEAGEDQHIQIKKE